MTSTKLEAAAEARNRCRTEAHTQWLLAVQKHNQDRDRLDRQAAATYDHFCMLAEDRYAQQVSEYRTDWWRNVLGHVLWWTFVATVVWFGVRMAIHGA